MDKKYLYFATGTVDADDATEEVVMIPADKISYMEMRKTNDLRIFFDKSVGQEVLGADGDNKVEIALDITVGKHKEVMEAIAGAIASASAINNPMIVVADSENSKFISPYITACADIFEVVDAT